MTELDLDTSKKGGIKKAIRNRGYLALCFIVPALLMWLVYASMKVYPFGEESVLVLDLNGQYVYYFEALRDIITGGGSLLYSFRRALGGEFLGIIGYYLASPLSLIVALFPKEMITEALLCIFLIKTGLSGLTFGIYLDRTRKRNPVTAVMFSTMYALCAYAVVMQHNTMWIDNLYMLPLILLGLEELIVNRKYKLFIISLSIAVFSNFYIGYMTCIFVAIYSFYFYFSHSDEERNPRGETFHLPRAMLRVILAVLLVVCITAVMIWSSYTALKFGKTEFTEPNYGLAQNFDFLDMISKLYFGSYDTVRPEGWPFLYTGMLTVMLMPLFFFLKNVSVREKIATGLFVTVMFLCFNLSTLDIFWHGMQKPNWLNYRYSFMVCFILLILAHRVFENIDELGYKPVIISSITAGLILMVLQKLDYENLPDLECVWASLAFIAVYLLMMKGVTIPKLNVKNTSILILTIFIGFEMYASGLHSLMRLDNDVVYTSRTTYRNHMDTYQPAFDTLQDMDKSFYRSEKVVYKRNNDNLAQGVFGLSNSTSTLNADTIEFLSDIGLASQSHWTKYIGSTPATDSLLGIKYLVGLNKNTLPEYYTEVGSAISVGEEAGKTIHIYENPYAMSVVFGADEDITKVDIFGDDNDIVKVESFFDKLKNSGKGILKYFGLMDDSDDTKQPVTPPKSEAKEKNPFQRLNAIYAGLLGEDEANIFVNLPSEYPETNNISTSSITDHTKYEPVDSNSPATVSYKITAETDDVIYMYMPSVYARECKLTVNGSPKGTYFGNETHRIVELGSYSPGAELTIKLELQEEALYIETSDDNYFYYFDEDVYLDLVPQLKGSEFNITEWSEDTLIGDITISEGDDLVFTTIPYDEGWKVTCDGEEVEIFEVLDSLIAFRLPEGKHELTMKYRPDCFVYGSIISVGGIVIFAVICIAELVWKKVRSKKVSVPESDEIAPDSDSPSEDVTESDIPDEVSDEDITTNEDVPEEDIPEEEAVTEEDTDIEE